MAVVTHHPQAGSIVVVADGHAAGHLAVAWRRYLTAMTVPPPPAFLHLLKQLEASQAAWVASAAGQTQGVQPARLHDSVAGAGDGASSAHGYTTREVKTKLGCSRQYVDKLRIAGELPAVETPHGFRFPTGPVDEFCARRAG